MQWYPAAMYPAVVLTEAPALQHTTHNRRTTVDSPPVSDKGTYNIPITLSMCVCLCVRLTMKQSPPSVLTGFVRGRCCCSCARCIDDETPTTAHSPTMSKPWDRHDRQKFATLLVVPLPADYIFPANAQGITEWQVRREPSQFATPIGTLRQGDRFTVTDRRGDWIHFQVPRSTRMGWATVEANGVRCIRPVYPPVVYPWQRARGSGLMYEDILTNRRAALREADLASDETLLKEWHDLIAELDAVMRLTHGYVAMIKAGGRSVPTASKPGRASRANDVVSTATDGSTAQRRPRSNSFFGFPRRWAGDRGDEASVETQPVTRRPRANSFSQDARVEVECQGESEAKGIWKTWKLDSPGWVAPSRQTSIDSERSGDDLLREQERAFKAQIKREAKERIEQERKQQKTYRRLLTEKLLREHDRKSQETSVRKPRSNSLSLSLSLSRSRSGDRDSPRLVLEREWHAGSPGNDRRERRPSSKDTHASSHDAHSPKLETTSPNRSERASSRHQERTGRSQSRSRPLSRTRSISPSGSVRSSSSRRSDAFQPCRRTIQKDPSWGAYVDNNLPSRRGHRSRSVSVPSRRADGARTHVFVPAAQRR
eukprot:m.137306 g.137306  ORF g.137306 m.137306 type:complete len:598 (+) comp11457_c0_seq8:1958-3751(+)